MADVQKEDQKRNHYFHAEAHALAGNLELPFKQEIKKQAFVKLEGELAGLKPEEESQRNYFSQHGKNFRLEGIISYGAAHTQVSGHRGGKHPEAAVTLATSVVERLNVLNVVTADRVVAQISTTHFPDRYAPEVTFLGTHFENLRIARHRAEICLNLDVALPKITAPTVLHTGAGSGLMNSLKAQYQRMKTYVDGVKDEALRAALHIDDGSINGIYGKFAKPDFASIENSSNAAIDIDKKGGKGESGSITCSLVDHIDLKNIPATGPDGKPKPIVPSATSFGHVIHVPDFGNIFLAELTVNHNSFNLVMIRLEMGCLAKGSSSFAAANVNGKGGSAGGP